MNNKAKYDDERWLKVCEELNVNCRKCPNCGGYSAVAVKIWRSKIPRSQRKNYQSAFTCRYAAEYIPTEESL